MQFRWPLMKSNFQPQDFDAVLSLLYRKCEDGYGNANLDARLTQGEQVRAFEREFAAWQGQKYAVMVNSGSSANLLTMAAYYQQLRVSGAMSDRVLVPCITWASDVTSVLHAGFEPVFVDVDRQTLGMDNGKAIEAVLRERPAAVFITHCFGYNALPTELLFKTCTVEGNAVVFEDCCESIGARTRWAGRKHRVGCFGLASNFSFYYAHHMTTVEGGMVCTDDRDFAEAVRMLRGHGLAREHSAFNAEANETIFPDLDPQFIFVHEGYNCRSTEINAAIGRSQLRRLDEGIERRRELAKTFYLNLDPAKYETGYDHDTASPYGLVIQLKEPDDALRGRVQSLLAEERIETRRGVAGGGNQLRQPYLRRRYGTQYAQYPNAEHLHFFAYSIGLWPDLPREDVLRLAGELNRL